MLPDARLCPVHGRVRMTEVKAVEFEAELKPGKIYVDNSETVVLNTSRELYLNMLQECDKHVFERVRVLIEFIGAGEDTRGL